MNLSGGIDTYSFDLFDRRERDTLPEGRLVVFLNQNGYDTERELANKLFDEGQVLTVKEIYIGRTSSEVEFVEFPNKKFNTVMFDDLNV